LTLGDENEYKSKDEQKKVRRKIAASLSSVIIRLDRMIQKLDSRLRGNDKKRFAAKFRYTHRK